MHLLLTDRLVCPRCGPGFGLILLADQLVERRVLAGGLGCPNCRDRFPVADGFADLRAPPRSPLPMPAAPASPEAESSAQLAALLGVSEGPGHVALVGALAAHADALADRIPGVEVVAVDAGMRAATEREGVSRLVAGSDLPFQPWTFRALAADGTRARPEEWARLVGRGGRIVISRPEEDAAERLERAGTRLLLRQPDWIVALVETS